MSNNANLPAAPEGSHWEWKEVSTNHGKDSLGERPMLVWDSIEGAVKHYGEEGVCDSINGTSLLVSYQGIARRLTLAGSAIKDGAPVQTDDEINAAIAKAIFEFRPGKRTTVSTPVAAATRNAKAIAEKLGDQGDAIGNLLASIRAKLDSGEMTPEDVANLQL